MKKHFLLVLFIIFNFYVSNGQSVSIDVKKSEVFTDEVKNSIIVLGEKTSDDGILIVRSYRANFISPSNGYYIEKYNADLKLIKEFDYRLKSDLSQKHNVTLGIFYVNEKINIVEIFYDLKEKHYLCQVTIIDDNFVFSKKELFRISREKMKSLGNFNLQAKCFDANSRALPDINSGDFSNTINTNYKLSFFKEATISKDNKSDIVMVLSENKLSYSIILDYKNDGQEGFSLFLFNNKSEQIFFKEVEIDGKEKDLIFQNFQISDDGKSVFILAKNFAKKTKVLKYGFDLTKISATESITKSIEIEDKFIKTVKVNFRDDKIYCIGFYATETYKDNYFVCFFKFNEQNLEAEQIKFSPFTKQFIQDKFGKQTNKDIKDLKIKTISFENNTIFLTAEEVYEVTQNNSNIGTGMPFSSVNGPSSYHFDDIVCLKLSNEGELIWSRNINKKQSYTYSDDTYVSYFSTIINGVSYIFINASDKIKELKNDRIEFKDVNPNQANLFLLTLSNEGVFDYRFVLIHKQNEVPFIVSKGIVIGRSCYFLGRKGKKKQLVKVDL